MTNAPHDLSGITYEGKGNHLKTRIALVLSKWNYKITSAMADGAEEVLLKAGLSKGNIQRIEVPGSFELPMGAQTLLESSQAKSRPQAVICIGCVIQGETRHFEFINQAVSQGVMQLGLKHHLPVIFGVLTPDTEQQALDRAGGKLGNKGCEAAVAALEMLDLKKRTQKGF